MGLLLAFQIFWLKKAYDEQADLLKKQTDNLFQQAVQQMQEAMIEKMLVKPMQGLDSRFIETVNLIKKPSGRVVAHKVLSDHKSMASKPTFTPPPQHIPHEQKVIEVKNEPYPKVDSTTKRGMVRVLISTTNDSLRFDSKKLLPDSIIKKYGIRPAERFEAKDIQSVQAMGSNTQSSSFMIRLKDSTQRMYFSNVDKVKQSVHLSHLIQRIDNLQKDDQVSVTVQRKEDSAHGMREVIPSIVFTMKQFDGKKPITIRLQTDSLRLKDIQKQYKEALDKSNIRLPFEVTRLKAQEKAETSGFVTTEIPCGVPSNQRFVAIFPEYQGSLFRKIAPQLLFSVFLMTLVSLAFGLIYQNLRQQRRLAELKNDFISNVTHELKTPIATVSVAIEALRNFNAIHDPARTQEYLEISRNELSRLSMLVDKVLKMSAFEKQDLELKLEWVDVKMLIEEILNSMKLQFEKFGALVSFDWTGEQFNLQADRTHLMSVIYNLLDNALKYSPERPEIQVELQDLGNEIKLSVQDNGLGIPTEYREKIFEKFFRIPTGDRHNVKGHGLGLSYVASVVAKHSGAISVSSTEGQGSCFTVKLSRSVSKA